MVKHIIPPDLAICILGCISFRSEQNKNWCFTNLKSKFWLKTCGWVHRSDSIQSIRQIDPAKQVVGRYIILFSKTTAIIRVKLLVGQGKMKSIYRSDIPLKHLKFHQYQVNITWKPLKSRSISSQKPIDIFHWNPMKSPWNILKIPLKSTATCAFHLAATLAWPEANWFCHGTYPPK